ncbi:hypothetical protein CEXT_473311 [Caerostris extrusa]|uniref:Secreted protein n=1 Tax=Caerostris extrusa TaxID=172846 RepID=A0AAV4S4M4_CAEEX|nr:hypothetical protein CEXT_473311 [Caerostris extrusa]
MGRGAMQMPGLSSLCPAISACGIGAFGGAFSGVRVRRPNGKSTCAGATLERCHGDNVQWRREMRWLSVSALIG